MTCGGFAISTRGSLAARAKRASALIWMPGAMTPPRYSPFGVTQSNVSRSEVTNDTGPFARSYAATR